MIRNVVLSILKALRLRVVMRHNTASRVLQLDQRTALADHVGIRRNRTCGPQIGQAVISGNIEAALQAADTTTP
jgi:hypothetical protein